MSLQKQQAQELIDFIHESPSTYHAINKVREELTEAGFQELDLRDEWNIEKGGKYFTTKNGSAIFAFHIGNGEIEEEGFQLICAHSDAPGFKIKPNPEIEVEGNYIKLNTEVYGGPILNTWMDRPLSIAGRVCVKSNDPLNPEHQIMYCGQAGFAFKRHQRGIKLIANRHQDIIHGAFLNPYFEHIWLSVWQPKSV